MERISSAPFSGGLRLRENNLCQTNYPRIENAKISDQIVVWFVCRLKENSVPIISRVTKGVAKRYIGQPLNQKVNLRGSIVEVWCKLRLPGKGFIEVRLIGFRFPKSKAYRWYATNLPDSMLLAQWIYPIYRLRWQIELFFKSIKSVVSG